MYQQAFGFFNEYLRDFCRLRFILFNLFLASSFFTPLSAQEEEKYLDTIENHRQDTAAVIRSADFLFKRYYLDSIYYAIYHGKIGLAYAEASQNYAEIQRFTNNLGIAYDISDQSEASADMYMRCLAAAEELSDTFSLAYASNNLGLLYINITSYDQAERYLNDAFLLVNHIDDPYLEVNIWTNFGILAARRGAFDSAFQFYRTALEMSHEQGDTTLIIRAYNNLSSLYISEEYEISKGQQDTALSFLHKSLALAKAANHRAYIGTMEMNIAVFHKKTQTPDSTEIYLKKAEKSIQKANVKRLLIKLYAVKINFYENKNDYKQAFLYTQKQSKIEEALAEEKSNQKIAQMQSAFDLSRAQQKLEIQELDLALMEKGKMQRNYLIIALFVFSVMTSGLFLTNRKKAKLKVILQNQKISIQEKEKALIKVALEKTKLEEKKLKIDIRHKNKQLSDFSLFSAQKNELLKKVLKDLESLSKTNKAEQAKLLKRTINTIKKSLNSEKTWEQFQLYFEQVHEGFFQRLKTKFPDLTASELRLCALIRLNISNKEIADILNIAPASVEVARYRLRKKLNLNSNVDLLEFILNF